MSSIVKKISTITVILYFTFHPSFSQCPTPQLYDGSFTPGVSPVWMNCINLASSPDSFQVVFGSPGNITSYVIDFGDGSSAVSGVNWNAGSYIYHTYQNLGTYTVTLSETNNGCTTTITGTVINERTPTAGIVGPPVGQNAGCAPHMVCFGNSSYNVTQSTIFTWDFGDGTTEVYGDTNAGQQVCHTYLPNAAACGITVSLTAQNNCGVSTTTWNPVDIFDIDQASITPANPVLCYPDTTVTFTNTSNLNCLSGTRYIYWDFGDGTTYGWTTINTPVTHSFPGIGTYTIMMVDSNGCGPDTAYATVTIVNQPVAGLAATPDTVCAGQSITFQNLSSGGGNQFTWNFGDGNSNTVNNMANQTHIYNSPGSYTVSLTSGLSGATGSCTDVASVNVVVLSAPGANFLLDNNQACDSLTVNITNQTTNGVSWFWDFGNGDTSSLQNPPAQFYNNDGNYQISVQVTSANGCTNSSYQGVNVYESPIADFSVNQACVGDMALFVDISSSSDSIVSWNWNFGDGGTSNISNPTHTYQTGGILNVSLVVNTLFCSNSNAHIITIDTLPVAAMIPDLTDGCADLTVDFTNNSTGAVSYLWLVNGDTIGNGINFNHTFTNSSLFQDSVYQINLISQTAMGCKDDTSVNVIVHPLPVADFSSDATPQCSPLEVNFTNASTNYTNVYWDFDGTDSSLTANTNYTFINNSQFIQTYTTRLIVISQFGCVDSTDEIITIYPKPDFDFQADSGCGPLAINFTSNSGAVIYNWDFGDGGYATGINTSHTFTNSSYIDSNYTVQLIATSSFNCSDTSSKQVVVYSKPKSIFAISPGTQTFPNSTIGFINLSQNANSYTWGLGDTIIYNVFEPDSHVFSSHGNFTITLTAQNNYCADTSKQEAVVVPAIPIADFNLEAEGCRPLTISINNGSIYADEFYWDFGDGGVSTQQNPSYTYYNPGVYTVSLIATGEGGQNYIQKQDVVIVHEVPQASFTANPKLVHLPNETVNFYNLSLNADDYFWDFGDGKTSFEEYPEYTYQDLGEFIVTLVATNQYGCADTANEFITTIAGGDIVIPNAFTPNPLGGNGGQIGVGGLNDVFYPITEGVTNFNMKIFNRWGELLFESNSHQIGWDGYYKGDICKQDVYVYQLQVKFENGETVEKVGDVTLIR